jgi:hypothetical protein
VQQQQQRPSSQLGGGEEDEAGAGGAMMMMPSDAVLASIVALHVVPVASQRRPEYDASPPTLNHAFLELNGGHHDGGGGEGGRRAAKNCSEVFHRLIFYHSCVIVHKSILVCFAECHVFLNSNFNRVSFLFFSF